MQNRIDLIRPDAPELATRGTHKVGVTTKTFDVSPSRSLTVEIWYPAVPDTLPGTVYETLIRDGVTATSLTGFSCRDAAVGTGTAPLIVISHGNPGNRFLMSHLAESLAAKGFVVAAPDHVGSTYDDQQEFGVTLLNRPLDQRGVIDAMAALDGDLGALVDCANTGLIGYSMGGYGALIYGGAGLADTALDHARAPQDGTLVQHLAGSGSHAALRDPRLKAIMPIGPWGNAQGMWDASGLAGMDTPMLMVAGTADEVSNYAAMRAIFDGAASDRYLLSFTNAGHNAAAPIPAPTESWMQSEVLGWPPFEHYGDAVWDTVRMNNIAQHFAAAFMGLHLRGDDASRYLDDDLWPGFAPGTQLGLTLDHLPAPKHHKT